MILKGNFFNKYNIYNNILAFSLIELSIVLIIIGLLVAGITGGQSLIESAKITKAINNFRDIERATFTFIGLKDRFPGDCYNDLTFRCNFDFPYDGTNMEYGKPNSLSAPFVDLYLEGVSDFKPVKTDKIKFAESAFGILEDNEGSLPYLLDKMYSIRFDYGMQRGKTETSYRYRININKVFLIADTINPGFKVDFIEKLDAKIDDGKYNSGIVRGACVGKGATYNISYKESTECHKLIYQTNIEK